MKELGHLKRYKMKLTTLSPVFIGSGEALSGLDYFFDNSKNQLNIIDENKIAKYLNQNHLIDGFIKYIANKKDVKFFEWAKINNINPSKLDIYKKIYKYSSKDIKVLNKVNLIIRNTAGKAYIPGSSIKGAIRTAILIKKLKENPELRLKYQQKIKNIFEQCDNRKDINNVLSGIEKDIETDLLCISAPTRELSKESLDVFRGIQISDSLGIEDKNLNLYKKCDYTLHSQNVHFIPLFRECINSYVDTEFSITLDTNISMLQNIDIEYILKALEEYAKFWHTIVSVFDKDSDRFNLYMPNEDEDYNANFCIGGGAGFLTKTIIYSILDKETAKNAVRIYLDKNFTKNAKNSSQKIPAHNHEKQDKEISPRTLKLAEENGDYINLGWCNISIVKE